MQAIRTKSNGDIICFTNSQFGQLRATNIDGEPWLMATDVARRLGYKNPQKAIRDHVEEEDRTVNESFTVNGTAPMLINESGLHCLILSSKLPQAKAFKRWVTAEVLPQIRRTGGYMSLSDTDNEMAIMSKALVIAQRTLDEMRPMADFGRALSSSHGSALVGDLAKVLTQNGVTVGRTRLFRWLRDNGYLFQNTTRPIQRWVEAGLFEVTPVLISTAHHGDVEKFTTRVTCKGQQYFVDGFLSGQFVL